MNSCARKNSPRSAKTTIQALPCTCLTLRTANLSASALTVKPGISPARMVSSSMTQSTCVTGQNSWTAEIARTRPLPNSSSISDRFSFQNCIERNPLLSKA